MEEMIFCEDKASQSWLGGMMIEFKIENNRNTWIAIHSLVDVLAG